MIALMRNSINYKGDAVMITVYLCDLISSYHDTAKAYSSWQL